MVAQDAYARKQYAHKHFSRGRRSAYLSALFAGHAIRAIAPRAGVAGAPEEGAKLAMRTLFGRAEPPFGAPPQTAIRPRSAA